MRRFDGKVALVTGAAGGIGGAVARRLGEEGATVVCADVDLVAAEQTASAVAGIAVGCDVTDAAAVAAAVSLTTDRYGQLDVLVNAHGIGAFVKTTELDQATWDRVIAVNLSGTFQVCQAALPALLESQGAIVNIASRAGLMATPYNAAYAASKGGVVMFTKSLALEFGKSGLRANCVCPAGVDTPMLLGYQIPSDADPTLFTRGAALNGRLLAPEEVAAAVAYLASDEAVMVTGVAFPLDGGASA